MISLKLRTWLWVAAALSLAGALSGDPTDLLAGPGLLLWIGICNPIKTLRAIGKLGSGSVPLALLLLSAPSLAEPLQVSINVTTTNPIYAPAFENCIKEQITQEAHKRGLVPPSYVPWSESSVDVHLVTVPAGPQGGAQKGVAAAVSVLSLAIPLRPTLYAVTAGTSYSDMRYICRAAMLGFYEYVERVNNATPPKHEDEIVF